jgi:hypothetical protein
MTLWFYAFRRFGFEIKRHKKLGICLNRDFTCSKSRVFKNVSLTFDVLETFFQLMQGYLREIWYLFIVCPFK